MKKLISISLLLLSSCIEVVEQPKKAWFKRQLINIDFHVESVGHAKYSPVIGFILHNGIKVNVSNGNSGYYHKSYNLNRGDIVNVPITIYYYNTNSGYGIDFGSIDISKYEKKI